MATQSHSSLSELENRNEFLGRHLSLNVADINGMLTEVGAESLDDLTAQIVPKSILREPFLQMDDAIPEAEALANLKALADQNKVYKSFISKLFKSLMI